MKTSLLAVLVALLSSSAVWAKNKPLFQCTSMCDGDGPGCVTSTLDLVEKGPSSYELTLIFKSSKEPAPVTILKAPLDECAVTKSLFFCKKDAAQGGWDSSFVLTQQTRSSLVSPKRADMIMSADYFDLEASETIANPLVDWATVKRITGGHNLLPGFAVECSAK